MDDMRKIIYCSVPKVGSTNMKIALAKTGGVLNDKYTEMLEKSKNISSTLTHGSPSSYVHGAGFLKAANLKRLSSYSQEEIIERLENYFKFVIVRGPWSRLISAYNDKLGPEGRKAFFKPWGTKMIERYRKHPDKEALRTGFYPTFDEFLQFVVKEGPHGLVNNHWQRVSEI